MRTGLLMLVVCAGCGGAIPQDPAETTTSRGTVAPRQTVDLTRDTEIIQARFEATREQVWKALHDVHESLGIPFSGGDLASGSATFQLANQIRTVAGKPANRYLDCGQGPAGARVDSYRLNVKLVHRIESSGPGVTALRTVMEASARNPGISSDPVPCNSRGVLETEIGGMVALRLKPAP